MNDMNDSMSQWHADALRNALTAEQVDSASVERPSREVGMGPNAWRVYDPDTGDFPVWYTHRWEIRSECTCFVHADKLTEEQADEITQAHNKTIAAVEAQLAEAVELLRGCEDDWQGQLTDTEANTLADRRRAFLAKVKP